MGQEYKTKEFEMLLNRIENASDYEIGDIMQAVIRRYKNLFPGWQIIFLSVPSNDEKERVESIEQMLEFLKDHKTL